MTLGDNDVSMSVHRLQQMYPLVQDTDSGEGGVYCVCVGGGMWKLCTFHTILL